MTQKVGLDTKTALMNAAEQAVRQRGFDGFSYADLSAEVGIRKASIHHHFPTKADLAVKLMQRYNLMMQDELNRLISAHDQASDRLLGLIAIYRKALGGGTIVCLCVSFSTSLESLSENVIKELRTFREMILAWISDAFVLGQEDCSILDPKDHNSEAAAMLALLEGAHLIARAERNPARFDQALAALNSRLG